MKKNKEGSIFSTLPNFSSPFGNWEEEIKKNKKEEEVFITEISGIKEVEIGKFYVFAVSEFSRNDFYFDFVISKIKWGYATSNSGITEIEPKYKIGNSISWQIPEVKASKIKLYAWIENSNRRASFEIKIKGVRFDRSIFIEEISMALKKKFREESIIGLNFILDRKEIDYPNIDNRFFAYILASIYHESTVFIKDNKTNKTFEIRFNPKEEVQGASDAWYWNKYKNSKKEEYSDFDHIYYGRGYIQLTGYENYKYVGEQLDKETPEFLLQNPNILISSNIISLKVTFEGMINGWYTRGIRKLGDYFNENKTDWIFARLIVNGYKCKKDENKNCLKDKDGKILYEEFPDNAKNIAESAIKFYNAILKAGIQNL